MRTDEPCPSSHVGWAQPRKVAALCRTGGGPAVRFKHVTTAHRRIITDGLIDARRSRGAPYDGVGMVVLIRGRGLGLLVGFGPLDRAPERAEERAIEGAGIGGGRRGQRAKQRSQKVV